MDPVRLDSHPNAPTDVPANMNISHFDLGDGKFARCIVEYGVEIVGDVKHGILFGQAYEVNENGNLVSAGAGYPSRTQRTSTSFNVLSIGNSVTLLDGWVRSYRQYDPVTENAEVVQAKPTEPGVLYGQLAWDDRPAQDGGQVLYEYVKGEVPQMAERKAKELQSIIDNSNVINGFSIN